MNVYSSSYANDSIFIKFIHRSISINEFEFGSHIQFKNRNFLFLKNCDNDSIIDCFIFKDKKLFSSGKLQIISKQSKVIALRSGYWLYSNQKVYKKVYFINDEKFEEEKLPNENSPLPGRTQRNLKD